jgi:hypothetical protein
MPPANNKEKIGLYIECWPLGTNGVRYVLEKRATPVVETASAAESLLIPSEGDTQQIEAEDEDDYMFWMEKHGLLPVSNTLPYLTISYVTDY